MIPRRFGEIPFAGLTAALVAGIVAADLFRDGCFFMLVAGQVLLLGAALCAHLRKRSATASVVAHLAVALAGWLVAAALQTTLARDSLQYQLSHDLFPLNEATFIEGCLVEEPRMSASAIMTTVELQGYRRKEEWVRCRGTIQVRIAGSADAAPADLQGLRTGDRILAWATMRVPTGYSNPGSQDLPEFLRRKGILLFGQVKSPRLLEVLPDSSGSALGRAASCLRARLRRSLEPLRSNSAREAAVLSSILLGDSAWLDPATRETFQNAGTYHVLVVSGLHVAWIAWVTTATLKLIRLPGLLVGVLSALMIPFYALLVGFHASVSRALWMYSLYAFGQLLHRRGHPANIALAAAFLLLAWRPNWLYETGFQLSFVSVLAITLTAMPIQEEVLSPMLRPLLHAGDREPIVLTAGIAGRIGRRLRIESELLAEASGDLWGRRWEKILLVCGRLIATVALAVGGMLLISLSVQVWLEPLLAYHFNRISWVAPLANIFVLPLASAVLACGAAGVCLAGILPLADGLLAAAAQLSRLLFDLAFRISDIPGAWMRCVTPGGVPVTVILLSLFAWFVLDWRKKWIPCISAVTLLALLAAQVPPIQYFHAAISRHGPQPVPEGTSQDQGSENLEPCPLQREKRHIRPPVLTTGQAPDRLELTILDVGQGDATVVRFPDASTWVVDAGGTRLDESDEESGPRFDIGEAVVSRYLWHEWIRRLDLLVVSHAHMDHGGGMPALIRNFRTAAIVCNGDRQEVVMRRILVAAAERMTPIVTLSSGYDTLVGGVRVRVLNASQVGSPRTGNDSSLVLQLIFGRFSALLTGDIEKASETNITTRWQCGIRSDLLKVAHHGSRTSTSDMFLNYVRPRWAVISASRNNPFGEPAREVVLRLTRRGIRPLSTMDQGAITLETDGERYTLKSFVGGDLESGILH